MRTIIGIIAVIAIGYVLQIGLPWYSIAIACFLVAAIVKENVWKSFLIGFMGIGLLWGIKALWIDLSNESMLSAQIGELFNGLPSFAILLITALLGGLIGGLAAMTGQAARDLV